MMANDYTHKNSFWQSHKKQFLITALTVQNAALVCFLRYSAIMPLVTGQRYFASTAIFITEVIKFTFFLSIALYEIAKGPSTPDSSTLSELLTAVTKAMFTGDSWKLAVPAMLYALQNSLQYIAATNLDAATFSSTYQLKLFTTAVFGVLLLNRPMGLRKSLSLVAILAGVAVVFLSVDVPQGQQVPSMQDLRGGPAHISRALLELRDVGADAVEHLEHWIKRSATYEGIEIDFAAAHPRSNAAIGFLAAITACILSGVAGVYVEKILRTRSDAVVSVSVRNVQLSFYSLWPTLFLGVLFMDGEYIAKSGFFAGYNSIVWVVVVLQAIGGILVALTLDSLDSIIKAYATAASTILVLLVNGLLSGKTPSILYIIGTIIILAAVLIYRSSGDENKLRPPPINVSYYEKSEDSSYFDIDSSPATLKSPLRDPMREALSTSRPTTPVNERRHIRART